MYEPKFIVKTIESGTELKFYDVPVDRFFIDEDGSFCLKSYFDQAIQIANKNGDLQGDHFVVDDPYERTVLHIYHTITGIQFKLPPAIKDLLTTKDDTAIANCCSAHAGGYQFCND